MRYLFAIRVRKCDETKYCIFKTKKKCGEKELKRCPLPIALNPVCTCKNRHSCMRMYDIYKYKEDYYIFYRCSYCSNNLKISKEELYDKILEPLDNPDIYYGRPLKKLIGKVIPKDVCTNDLDSMVEIFSSIFKEIHTEME
jgi:PHP family Zn ribbon phosphoesterase